jgi:superfamily II DNA or RNA helicase
MYAAKAIDMTGAKVIAGEWAEKEIEERGKTIIGDIVAEWQDKTRLHFGGPVKTIVFSATVEHGEELCKQFNAAGYNFQQISYKDGSDEHRRALIDEFRKPDSIITGLVSCEVFTKGFDVPDILCGIAARPYRKSLSSHIQQMGRVMRTAPGKSFGLWLDHCGNVLRFKEDTDEIFSNGLAALGEGDRDAKARKEPSPKEKKEITCSCGYVFPYRMDVCPACGKEHKRLSTVETVAGVMELVGGKPLPGFLADRKSVWRQIASLSMERKKGDVEAAKKFAKAQYMNIYQEWPKSDSMSDTEPCTLQVKNKVMGNLLRYVKGRAKAQRMAA